LLDGAEQLSWPRKRTLLRTTRHGGGLIVTTHRAGLLPTLYQCRTSPQLLGGLLEELEPQYATSEAELGALFRRHHGNVRNALRELYDQTASNGMRESNS
jgi:hypothetical protein